MNIGQAAEASGVSAKMIRYYESIGLIAAAHRTDAGYRLYTENEIQTLRFIRRARDLGFSVGRIKTLLALWEDRGRKSADVKKLARQYMDELDQDIQKLQSIRNELERLVHCCQGNNRPECPILNDLASHS
jgi:MerR family copper efflux transcriptional regulator